MWLFDPHIGRDCLEAIGHSLRHRQSLVAVFQVNFYQYNFIGFADINGVHNDITGSPRNLPVINISTK